jgi:hypothetical protein
MQLQEEHGAVDSGDDNDEKSAESVGAIALRMSQMNVTDATGPQYGTRLVCQLGTPPHTIARTRTYTLTKGQIHTFTLIYSQHSHTRTHAHTGGNNPETVGRAAEIVLGNSTAPFH